MSKKQKLINLAYSSSKYLGKHIIIIRDKIYASKSGVAASKLLEKLMKKFPQETPVITYISKAKLGIWQSGLNPLYWTM